MPPMTEALTLWNMSSSAVAAGWPDAGFVWEACWNMSRYLCSPLTASTRVKNASLVIPLGLLASLLTWGLLMSITVMEFQVAMLAL
jgi:hypothetical protein